jgi:hypothetical protein
MNKLVKGLVIVISTTAFLTGCAAAAPSAVDAPNEDTSEVSNCTKFADFIRDNENAISIVTGEYKKPMFFGPASIQVMDKVGEPMPDPMMIDHKKVEFVANSMFAQECMSSSIRQAMLDYANR